jgi:hypothetical protein
MLQKVVDSLILTVFSSLYSIAVLLLKRRQASL